MIRIASTTLESILTSRPFASARESASSLRALIETPPRLRQGRNSVLDMVRQVVPPPNQNRRRRVSAKPKRTPLGPRLGRRGLRQRVRMATTAAPSTILKPPGSIAKLESEPNARPRSLAIRERKKKVEKEREAAKAASAAAAAAAAAATNPINKPYGATKARESGGDRSAAARTSGKPKPPSTGNGTVSTQASTSSTAWKATKRTISKKFSFGMKKAAELLKKAKGDSES